MEGEEIWKDVPGYEEILQVSNHGRVRRIITPTLSGHYLCIGMSKNGKPYPYRIHRLVMLAFVGERPPGLVINHINGIKTDNRLENLEYCTHAENMRHARYILKSWGIPKEKPVDPQRPKLTPDIVRELRGLVFATKAEFRAALREFAELYDVHENTIRRAMKGKLWKGVSS